MRRYLSTESAAEYLESCGAPFSKKTLEVWRCQGRGPAYKKIGRKVFYAVEDLDRFLQGERVETVDSLMEE